MTYFNNAAEELSVLKSSFLDVLSLGLSAYIEGAIFNRASEGRAV